MIDIHQPMEWRTTPLGEVTGFQNGYAFKSSTYRDDGAFVIRIGNVQAHGISLNNPAYVDPAVLGAENFFLCEGDLLISLTGNVGRVAVIRKEHLPAVLNQRVARVQPAGSVEKGFLFHLMRSEQVQRKIFECAKGAAQLNISTKDLARIEVPLPPLAEQKVIADKLDTLLAQVENTKARLERIPQILKRFRQSVLAAAVSGRLTEGWRDVDSNWETTTLIDCTTKIGDGLHGTPAYSEHGEYYFVNGNNLIDGSIVIKEGTKRVEATEYQKHKKDLGENTLLLSINGTIGNLALYQNEKVILGKSACYLNFNDKLKKEFGYVLLSSLDFIQYAHDVATGATIKNVPLKGVRNFKFALPPLAEQTEIVRRVDQLFAHADRIEQQVNNAMARVNNLTQSTLAKAFWGELTEQWRKDNPELTSGENSAEALLEQIKAERATMKPTKKTGKRKTTV